MLNWQKHRGQTKAEFCIVMYQNIGCNFIKYTKDKNGSQDLTAIFSYRRFLLHDKNFCKNCIFFMMYTKNKSRWKNAQIEMEILGKFILIDYIDIKDVRTYTKKTPHYNIQWMICVKYNIVCETN